MRTWTKHKKDQILQVSFASSFPFHVQDCYFQTPFWLFSLFLIDILLHANVSAWTKHKKDQNLKAKFTFLNPFSCPTLPFSNTLLALLFDHDRYCCTPNLRIWTKHRKIKSCKLILATELRLLPGVSLFYQLQSKFAFLSLFSCPRLPYSNTLLAFWQILKHTSVRTWTKTQKKIKFWKLIVAIEVKVIEGVFLILWSWVDL